MNISRVTIGIHWPIDILGGSMVGIVVALVVTNPSLNSILQDKLYNPLINVQEWIFNLKKH